MLKSLIILTLLCISTFLAAQTQISIDSISAYLGETVTVCDTVAGTFITKGEKPVTYLNLGTDYPNNKLTIVIFHKDLINFPIPPKDHYIGMNVCITGEISEYKEKLQIIAKRVEQIEII